MSADNNEQMPGGADPALLADIEQAAGEFTRADMPAVAASVAPAAAGDQQLAGAITAGLLITFGLLNRMRGDHWGLTPEEAGEAGAAYAAVIYKYFPGASGGPEITAILVTAGLLAPRLMIDKAKADAAALSRSNSERVGDGAQPE